MGEAVNYLGDFMCEEAVNFLCKLSIALLLHVAIVLVLRRFSIID